MAVKTFQVDALGAVHVYKRKGARSLRLSITSDRRIRVTIPSWATYAEALRFAESKSAWIQINMPSSETILEGGQHVGKAHRFVFTTGETTEVKTRIAGSEIKIIRPASMLPSSPAVQKAAQSAAIRAMRLEAQKLLPVRLKQLAAEYGFKYTSVGVKQLKGRWGSCDSHQNIVLNLFLMQLPWHLIDYVLVHELVHTKHMNHGEDFWAEFLRHVPQAKKYRTESRQFKPVLEAV